MSIAELIMTGTNRASESTAWVGESLAKLGQNVGAALAQKEAQNQAQAVLPVLQATYKSAFDKIGQGNLSEGYTDLMNAQLQFGASSNPFIQNMNQQMTAMSKQFADDYLRKSQIEAYNNRYSGGTSGGGGGGLPAGPQAFFGTNPADNEPLPTRENYVETVDGMPADNAMPAFTGGFSASLNEPNQNQEMPWSYQMPNAVQPTPEVSKEFDKNQQEYLGASPDKQITYQNNLSSTKAPIGTNVSQFDFSNIKSLRNVVGIAAPVENIVEVPESLSVTENNKGTSYVTKFNKKTTNDTVIAKSGDLVLTDVPKALSRISSNKTLSKFFKENELGNLDIGEKSELVKKRGKETERVESYYIGIDGKKDSYITISKDDFIAASTIQNLPSSAKTLDSTFIITDKPLPKEEPAATESAKQSMSVAEQVRSQYGKKEETTPAAATPAAQELTLEQQVQQELSGAKKTARTVTPQQAKAVEQSRISSQKSNLESEKRRLENLIYTVQRASGKKTLKAGITKETEAKVNAELDKINKQLASL
jgi:hypothetical protein